MFAIAPPFFFFVNDTATTEIYTLSLHDALPIYRDEQQHGAAQRGQPERLAALGAQIRSEEHTSELQSHSDLVCRLLLAKQKDSAATACVRAGEQLERISFGPVSRRRLCQGYRRAISFLFNDAATTEIYTLSLHDALPISPATRGARAAGRLRPPLRASGISRGGRSEEHTSELQSHSELVCRLLLEKK